VRAAIATACGNPHVKALKGDRSVVKRADHGGLGVLGGDFLEKQLHEHIDAAGEDEFFAGVAHDFADLFAIERGVAVRRAVLAHRFGVHGTNAALDEGVHEQLGAGGAQAGCSAVGDGGHIKTFEREWGFRGFGVIAFTVDLYEEREHSQIFLHKFGRVWFAFDAFR